MAVLTALAGLTTAGQASAGGTTVAQEPVFNFPSRPDLLPPQVTVHQDTGGTAPGYIFVNPKTDVITSPVTMFQGGPEILDNSGQPVWFLPRGDGNFVRTGGLHPIIYQGKPALAWWEGETNAAAEAIYGDWVVMDESYHIIARIDPGNDLPVADYHELLITPQDTAMFIATRRVQRLVDGVKRTVVDEIIQEKQIATGRVVFQWDSLDHISPSESYVPLPASLTTPWEYLHLDSLSLDANGNIIASGRHTSTVYDIDRRTGKILWRLGGKENDFTMEQGASFAYQHDAQWNPNGTLSLFDNTSLDTAVDSSQVSRALILKLDTKHMTASLVQSFPSPDGLLTGDQGSVQELPNGDTFVGWGTNGWFTEFSPSGQVVYDASFNGPTISSYRALRFTWTGHPTAPPAVAGTASGDTMTVHASWNGATNVSSWRVLAGPGPHQLAPVAEAARSGFETAIAVDHRTAYVAVQALDSSGKVLRTSPAAQVM